MVADADVASSAVRIRARQTAPRARVDGRRPSAGMLTQFVYHAADVHIPPPHHNRELDCGLADRRVFCTTDARSPGTAVTACLPVAIALAWSNMPAGPR